MAKGRGKARARTGARGKDAASVGGKALAKLQADALRHVLGWARGLPFYKRRLAKAGTVRGPDDMRKVPLLSKADLLRSVGTRRFPRACCSKVDELSFIGMTGGPGAEATDAPLLPVPLTSDDMARRGAAAARLLRATGKQHGRTMMLEEISHSVVHQALLRGLVDVGAVPVQLGRGFTLRHARHTIPRLSPSQMLTYPTYALFLSELLGKEGASLRLRKVYLWGEVGGSVPSMRRKVSQAFGRAAVFDIYALQELGAVAGECTAHAGLHGLEDMFLYEVVDPDNGEVLTDGEVGELVVTELSRSALPLIRYRTGDLTSIERRPCRCGRRHLRLQGIRGRVGRSVPADDGGAVVHMADLAEVVWSNPHLTGNFKVVPGEGVVIETKENRQMTRYYIERDSKGPLPARMSFERVLPRFHHRTEHMEDERYHRLLKEQTRLEG